MAYVDDVRNSFDVAEFCATVSAGVGAGRTTAELALRDKSAVSLASKALEKFLALAAQREAPDVIAAYVQYSPGGSEIFTALRAVSINKPITAIALDCITAIARYSLEPSNPVQALDGARSIVKDIVKARASLFNDIFLHDKSICAKKALIVLRLVASCHTMLAKELMNRINLAADHVAPALCSVKNNICRVPFMDLLFVLLACGDRDILFALATKRREVLINAMKVVTERTLAEIGKRPAYLARIEEMKAVRRGVTQPSHVQKKELIAAINLLLAIERHLLSILSHEVRHKLYNYPMLHCLAEIAAAELPPLTVAPALVIPDHEAMRKTARRIFVAIASDTRACRTYSIIGALHNIKVQSGGASLGFLIHVLESIPKICKQYLEDSTELLNQPSLSSTWLATAAITSTCVLRLRAPVQRFVEKEFFEKCLQSKDSLIIQTGAVILRAYCKVIAANEESRRSPERFLPKPDIIQKLVLFHGHVEEISKLRSDYEKIFSLEYPSVELGSMKFALKAGKNNPLRAEFAIREGIRVNRRDTFEAVVSTGYLARCITSARKSNDSKSRRQLWQLCKDVIASSELFPRGSEPEIEIFLAFLSTDDDGMDRYTARFIVFLFNAWNNSYTFYDEICSSDSRFPPDDSISVVSATIVQHLRKLNSANPLSELDEDKRRFQRLLVNIIKTVAAFQGLFGYGAGGSYLRRVLPQVIEPHEVWWDTGPRKNHSGDEEIIGNCRIVEELFSRSLTYPRTPLLQFVKVLSIFQLRATIEKSPPLYEGHAPKDSGRLWSSWSKLQREAVWTAKLDILQNLGCNKSERREFSCLILGQFHQSLHRQSSQTEMKKCSDHFRNMLAEPDYILSIAAILRITQDQSVRKFLVYDALEIRRNAVQLQENSHMLSSIIEDSLIHGIASQNNWDIPEIDQVISSVLQGLTPKKGGTLPGDQVSFCFSLMARLLQHEDLGTRIFAEIFISNAGGITLPDMRKLSLDSITHVARVLEASPVLWKLFSKDLPRWTAEHISSYLPTLLPVLRTILCSRHSRDGAKKSVIEKDKLIPLFLNALVLKKEALLGQHGRDEEVIIDAMGEIGNIILRTEGTSAAALRQLRSMFECNNDVAFQNIIFLLLKAFQDWNKKALQAQFSDGTLIEIITLIVRWFNQRGLELSNRMHIYVLRILLDLFKQLKIRGVTLYDLVLEAASFERDLISLCWKLCSNLSHVMQCRQELHGEITKKSTADPHVNDSSILLVLQTMKEVLSLDLLLDKAAKKIILSMCGNEGSMINVCLGLATMTSKTRVTPHVAFCELVSAAIRMLPRLGIEKEVAVSLSIIEGVLSSNVAGFSASLSSKDLAIRDCMDCIAQHLKLSQARSAHELPERRHGFFNPIKSEVLLMFENRRLLSTCTEVLRHSQNDEAKVMPKRNRPFHSQRSDVSPYDPIFVLRTFLVACAEALKAPRSALMDIGRVSKEGLLSVAITGMACEDEHVRALSYACLHSFSEFVGPISGVPVESAAALYIHRRQLSFLLYLLKNSISTPLTKVAPIFASWFRTCLREALSPSHRTNKIVTHLLCRAPTLDVKDCVGIQFLLLHDEFQNASEQKAIRLLSLEILRFGTWSLHDFNILRKRRLLDALVTYGPQALDAGDLVPIELFKVFSALLPRDDGLLSLRFINKNEMVPWIVPSPDLTEEEMDMVSYKLQLMQKVALCIPRTRWSKRMLPRFCMALDRIVKALVQIQARDDKLHLVDNLVDCYSAFIRLDSHQRRTIDSDVAQIYNDSFLSQQSLFMRPKLAQLIARQKDTLVGLRHYVFLLRSYLPNEAASIHCVTSKDTLSRADALEVCMAHAFVADGLLFRQSWKIDDVVDSELFAVLAQAMYACPTVWLTMACFSALQTKGHLSEELAQHADRIPGKIPTEIYPDRELQYSSVVDSVRCAVIEKLISCARHVGSGLISREERKKQAMSDLIGGLPEEFTEGVR